MDSDDLLMGNISLFDRNSVLASVRKFYQRQGVQDSSVEDFMYSSNFGFNGSSFTDDPSISGLWGWHTIGSNDPETALVATIRTLLPGAGETYCTMVLNIADIVTTPGAPRMFKWFGPVHRVFFGDEESPEEGYYTFVGWRFDVLVQTLQPPAPSFPGFVVDVSLDGASLVLANDLSPILINWYGNDDTRFQLFAAEVAYSFSVLLPKTGAAFEDDYLNPVGTAGSPAVVSAVDDLAGNWLVLVDNLVPLVAGGTVEFQSNPGGPPVNGNILNYSTFPSFNRIDVVEFNAGGGFVGPAHISGATLPMTGVLNSGVFNSGELGASVLINVSLGLTPAGGNVISVLDSAGTYHQQVRPGGTPPAIYSFPGCVIDNRPWTVQVV